MQVFLFLLAILMFTALVIIHEWGHFYVARRNGVDVEEFGLGIPPRAWSRRTKKGLVLSLNWLPIGGFVKLKGEHDGDKHKGSFGAASLGAKARILLAGVFMNLVAALAIFTFLALVGMPKLITADQFGVDQFSVKSDTKLTRQEVLVRYVEPNSPAQKAGLNQFDRINSVSANGQKLVIAKPEDLKKATTRFAGQEVNLNVTSNHKTVDKKVKLRSQAEVTPSLSTDDPKGYLGVGPTGLEFTRSTWSAPIVALGVTWQLTDLSLKGLAHAVAGLGSLIAGTATGNQPARANGQSKAESQVGGPVAVVKTLWVGGSVGYLFLLSFIAVISLTLAIFNVLPIPALDGGRLFLILVSRLILKKPLSKLAEERFVAAGMVLLLTLTVLVTIVDVRRFL